jgi:cobalt-zinc-cadmium resistance protein CzcA
MTEEGKPRHEAVLQGSAERLIPILMTALAAVLGLVPLALAAGEPAVSCSRRWRLWCWADL